MERSSTLQPRSATVLRGLLGLLLAVLVVPAVLVLLAVETRPRVAAPGPPDADRARLARDVAGRLAGFLQGDGADGAVTISEAELNALIGAAGRLAPGVAGRARVADAALALEFSAGAPLLPRGLWANARLALGAGPDGVRVTAARIGRLPLPPSLVFPAARVALDRLLGEGLGTAALASVGHLEIEPPDVTLRLALPGGTRSALIAGLRDRLLAALGSSDAERVYVHLYYLHETVDAAGQRGSALPFLRAAVSNADRLSAAGQSPGDDAAELRAALFALTLYCGEAGFGPAIGVVLPARMQGDANRCADRRLGGRVDLRRHFAVSAGVQAASTGAAAFGVGELKELLDLGAGGSGFSFDDMAANAAGARFASTLLDTPRAEWGALIGRIDGEADLLPALDGLPAGLDEAAFRARYGDVDSPAYKGLVAEIGRRIDALPLHRGISRGSLQ